MDIEQVDMGSLIDRKLKTTSTYTIFLAKGVVYVFMSPMFN